MSNLITNELSRSANEVLMDVAQVTGKISYGDIIKLGKVLKKEFDKNKQLVSTFNKLLRLAIDGEDEMIENVYERMINFVLFAVGKEKPININYKSTVIDNWGRSESTSKPEEIVKYFMTPAEWTDDDNLQEGDMGSYSIDELANKVVKVGDQILLLCKEEEGEKTYKLNKVVVEKKPVATKRKKVVFDETEIISADHHDTVEGVLMTVSKHLKKLGLYVYKAPSFNGTDSYGIVVSKEKYKNAKEAEASGMGMSMEDYKKFLKGEWD